MESYEKRYNNALERARDYYKANLTLNKADENAVLEDIFPELAESEDERIRKALITYFQRFPYPYGGIESAGTNAKEAIAWLEKQESIEEIVERCKDSWYNEGKIAGMAEGLTDDEKYQQGWHDAIEKKEEKFDNANKVEPKFKVGDWIVDKSGFVQQVLDFRGGIYTCTYNSFTTDCESNYHLWTIEDAKDGDVLTCYSDIKGQPIEQTGIIKQYVGRHGGCSNSFKAHFGVDWDNNVVIEGYMGSSNIYPATKKQRDTLMKAMADAGWQFDFEKKELKKIEQSSAWSEDDERIRKTSISFLKHYVDKGYENAVECIDWLKSLKDRVQPQLKQEWSEEDEVKINRVVACLENLNVADNDILLKDVDWLKSLKQRIGG